MNTYGNRFKVSLFGESHAQSVGSLLDFVPPGIPLKNEDFAEMMKRRKPGPPGTTGRIEQDEVEIESGVFEGFTTGAPVLLRIKNQNSNSKDYEYIKENPRPGHADLTARIKYGGYNDYRGGGMFSGRMTAALTAAGVVAKKILDIRSKIDITAEIAEIGGEKKYKEKIRQARDIGDSLGGTIECKISGVPTGLGEPYFESIESELARMMFSIPGVKGIEFGAGFKSASMYGSEYNDSYADSSGRTTGNNAGGINGGISNGNPIVFRLAVRPTATISKPQQSISFSAGTPKEVRYRGRHDTCFALRLPVIVEAAAAIVLADLSSAFYSRKPEVRK